MLPLYTLYNCLNVVEKDLPYDKDSFTTNMKKSFKEIDFKDILYLFSIFKSFKGVLNKKNSEGLNQLKEAFASLSIKIS